jgi:hypothetical protein
MHGAYNVKMYSIYMYIYIYSLGRLD